MTMSLPHGQILEEDLHAYVDDALSPEQRKEVQEYLDRHPEAASAVARLAAQRQLLRSTFASIADEPVPECLNLSSLIREHRDHRPWTWQMAASVFLAFGVGTFGGWRMHDSWLPSGGIAALAGEARSSYAAYAMDPDQAVEMGADKRTELVSLVSATLKQPIALPDLTKSGYRYAGGRLVATEHGSAGMFLYDRADGIRLAVMVRPMAHEREAPMMGQSTGKIGGYTWAAQGLGYSVVGTEGTEVLHPVANEVRRQIGAARS